ncbi:MotA/TolQ/ExbB proton channel family protein [Oscillospiraceae bacterium MB08-C2-2]|nr:MotA/TolQ/ExbB proton channel family protein [Oscillospiraceae bacterium MB08-C2-2]
MKKSKISLSAWFGFLLGIGFIFSAVLESHDPMLFWNLPSFFIIIGGTTATVLTVFPPSKLKLFFPTLRRAFIKTHIDIPQDIETLVELAKEARSKGLMALEDQAPQYEDDKFLQEGMLLIADGISEEDLRKHMEGVMYFTKKRHSKGASMIELVAATAPSLGLVGTYIGLIPMLTSLDDPTSLGPMMAIELVSSFYGGVIANVLFSPLAKRLKVMADEEFSRNELVLEGLLSIHQGRNPRMIEAELTAYMNIKNDKKGNSIDFEDTKKKKKKTKAA